MIVNEYTLGLFLGVQKCLTDFHNTVRYKQTDDIYDELIKLRGYENLDGIKDTLIQLGLFKDVDILDILRLSLKNKYSEETITCTGIINSVGGFFLPNRYCLPIYNVDGQVTAFVGYDPAYDARKYMTTPSITFVRSASMFGAESYYLSQKHFQGRTFVVEGIYDNVLIRHLGFPCLSTMGSELQGYKTEMLRRYNHLCIITDGDSIGRRADPRSTHYKRWKIPSEVPFTTVSLADYIKDPDRLITLLGNDIKDKFQELLFSNQLNVTIK